MKTILFLLALATCCLALPVSAYDGIDLYDCRISAQDRVNSRGEKLLSIRDILAQDRANYHRFGKRDRQDSGDYSFRTAEGREVFQRVRLRMAPALRVKILTGQTVDITVFYLTRDLIEVQEGLLDPRVG